MISNPYSIDGGAFDLGAGIPLFNICPAFALSLTVETAAAWLLLSGLGLLSIHKKTNKKYQNPAVPGFLLLN